MKDKNSKILNLILPIATIFAIILLWGIASKGIDNQFILPSIKSTAESFCALLYQKSFYIAVLSTLLRSLIAFAISFSIGFVLAVISTKNSAFKSAIAPIVSITRALPTIAIVLLLLLWTNSTIAPIIVTLLVVFPTIYTYIENAFLSLDKNISEAGRVDGASEFYVFRKIEFPQALPAVLSSIGSGISLNFKLMVAAEVISQTASSIGYMLNTSKVYFETAQMLALVCISVLLGVIIESVFNLLSKKISDWK